MWDRLGLDDTDESVYRHILSFPQSSRAHTARSTGLPEDEVVACEDRLVACGLVTRGRSGEIRPSLTGPATVAHRLREELEAEHARRRRQLGMFQAEMTRMMREQLDTSTSVPRPLVDRIPNQEAAIVRVAELMCHARTEVARAEPSIEPDRPSASDLVMPAEIRAVERGVEVRAIYPPTQLVRPVIRRMVDQEIRAGVEVRTARTPAANLTIVDRCVAVLGDQRGNGGQHTFLIREGLLVHTLHHLFETCWAQAGDAASFLAGSTGADPSEVSHEERLVLRLLGDGLKDEAVAKRLGISVRTVRRKICDLLHRLSAGSRFQAGVLAARRGWL
jgi:DNA-binding CsgD family transcriptional regulator